LWLSISKYGTVSQFDDDGDAEIWGSARNLLDAFLPSLESDGNAMSLPILFNTTQMR